ncbi:MAG: Transcriptional regulator, LuxR family protein [Bacillota bacterium]|jgi:DNA-binding CsgD family transcriptional regulator|nr:Transcriptional regulator, LuxR family protein [Bacillota bacterium]
MAHMIFLVHVLAFVFGSICILLSALLYAKDQNRMTKYYTLFLTSLLMILMERAFAYYKLANILDVKYADAVFWTISCLGIGLLIFSLPLFLCELLGLRPSQGKKLCFSFLALLPITALMLYNILPYKTLILNGIDLILFLLLLYCFCLAVVLRRSVSVPEIKRILSPFLILLAVWLPVVFLDFRLQQIPSVQALLPYGFLSIPIFYTAWNLLTIYFGRSYLKLVLLAPLTGGEQPPENDAKAEEDQTEPAHFPDFGLTDRENDVAALLIKGYSYQKISQELFVSLSTARTHGYNIYKKVGVTNKVELTNRMKYGK